MQSLAVQSGVMDHSESLCCEAWEVVQREDMRVQRYWKNKTGLEVTDRVPPD